MIDRDRQFARLNRAVTETDLVPQLHRVLSEFCGDDIDYYVLDAVELSIGFPVPVLTRYIFPLLPMTHERDYKDYPGLAFYDIQGLGVRTIQIAIGLAHEDMRKAVVRLQVALRLQKEQLATSRPSWWPYSYQVIDASLDHDFDLDITPGRLTQLEELFGDKNQGFEAYLWGKSHKSASVTELDFEQEQGGSVVSLWESSASQVSVALSQMKTLTASLL